MADNSGIPQNSYPNNYPGIPPQNSTYPGDPYQAPSQDPYAAVPTPNYDSYATQAPQIPDPYSPHIAGQTYDPYSSSAPTNPYGTTPPQSTSYDPNYAYPPDQFSTATTFQEKKTGNKMLLFAIIGVIVLLVIAAGVLVYLNLQGGSNSSSNDNKDVSNNSTNNGSSTIPEVDPGFQPDILKTGGESSPATQARKFANTKLTTTWILQKFQSQPYIDQTGVCKDLTKCGENADPDNDGITNIEEMNFDTDPLNSDTDRDNITDGDELYVYYTSPTAKDSDGDTYEDFKELSGCYSPADATDSKMSKNSAGVLNLSKIESNVEINPIHTVTTYSFEDAGATSADISKGYLISVCTPEVKDETAPTQNVGTNLDDTLPPETNNLSD